MQKNKRLLRLACAGLSAVSLLAFSACNLSLLFPTSDKESTENTPPKPDIVDTTLGRNGLINSLGKWNYYAAKKTIADYGTPAPLHANALASGKILPLSGFGYEDSEGNVWEEPTDKEDTQSATTPPPDTDDVVYYDLYSWGEFTVQRTVYFQMELTDETAFLGSRLGVGTVEVAVALGDNHDDLNMITFRGGDNFYSCMYHGYEGINEETGAEKYAFAAYRYIDGFYYVKNLKWEHYEFHLEVGDGDAVFRCQYRHTGDEDEQVRVIENTTYCIDKTVTYTIEELENYFSVGDKTENTNNSESVSA